MRGVILDRLQPRPAEAGSPACRRWQKRKEFRWESLIAEHLEPPKPSDKLFPLQQHCKTPLSASPVAVRMVNRLDETFGRLVDVLRSLHLQDEVLPRRVG